MRLYVNSLTEKMKKGKGTLWKKGEDKEGHHREKHR